jgi:hypothetical protein
MNKTLGLHLVVYSVLLAGLSYLTYYLAPALARTTLIAGLAGGALSLIWGLRAIAGSRGKALAGLTLIPICLAMLSQAVLFWGDEGQEMPGRRLAAVVTTVLFVLSIAMLMRTAYAGVELDVQAAGRMKNGGDKAQAAGKPASQAHAAKRA